MRVVTNMKRTNAKKKKAIYDPIVGFRAPNKIQKMIFEIQQSLGLSISDVLKMSVQQAYDALKEKKIN